MSSVLVIGGAGYFGRLLIDDLLKFTNVNLVVGTRQPTKSERCETVVADLANPESLETALQNIEIVICAAGPYQGMSTNLVSICIRRGIHYIDFADDRAFATKVCGIANENGTARSAVCTAWSTVSALSGALTRIAAAGQKCVESIEIHMAPGNRGARKRATVESLLHSVGTLFRVRQDGRWQTVRGWSQPRNFTFPRPVGTRIGYLVNVPDLEWFPNLFNAGTVEFRAGSELRLLNIATSGLAWFVSLGLVRDWTRFSRSLQRAAALFDFAGSDAGAVGVEVHGVTKRRVSIVADRECQRIAVMPASIMAAKLSSNSDIHGCMSPSDWISQNELRSECEKRGFRLIIEEL